MNLISDFLHNRKKKKSETGWEFLYWLQKNNFARKWNIGWYFYSIHRKGATCISLLASAFASNSMIFTLNLSFYFVNKYYCFQHEYVFAFKQARRREDDIAIVNTGMRVLFDKETQSSSWQIQDCSFSFGGLAPTTVMAMKTVKGLTGRYFETIWWLLIVAERPRQNFSLRYPNNIKQTSDENKEKY